MRLCAGLVAGLALLLLAVPEVAAQVAVPAEDPGTPVLARLRSVVGVLALVGLAWLLSSDRRRVPWRLVAWGLGLQIVFAIFILRVPAGERIFDAAGLGVERVLAYSVQGAEFVFGNLVRPVVPVGRMGSGGFEAAPEQFAQTGAQFAFSVLPTIIFFSSLMAVLYHLGIMQWLVRGSAWVMQRTMRTSGAESLTAAGNVFVGMMEAPLLVRPFVERMTESELMAVMAAGFATVAGGVLAVYVGMLLPYFPDVAGHMLAASVMSAPAALVAAKIMLPETETAETADALDIAVERTDINVVDAAARGASEGLTLALNVGAMLLAFMALIFLANGVLGWLGGFVGLDGLTFEAILGVLLAPLAWLMGVPWSDAPTVASLMGVKTVLNEFVAYLQLAEMIGAGGQGSELQPRSIIIATYALSGFANFGSVAMQIAGIGGIAPSRRQDLSRIGVRAMIAGAIAAFMTASVAGALL